MIFDARLAYIHSDTPGNIRVAKSIEVYRDLFKETHYIGAIRVGGLWDKTRGLSGVDYRIDNRTVGRGLRGISSTIRFMRFVREELERLKPDVVIATNEDFVLPFAFGWFPRPRWLVCDLIDSIAIRTVDRLRYFAPVWNAVSGIAKASADALIEVTEERLARHRILPRRTAVIINSPPWSEVAARVDIPRNSVYVCGSILDDVNGVETLLAAAEKLPGVQLVFAGRPIGNWIRDTFLKHPRVLYLGETTPQESLRIAKSCRAIFAHYKPVNTNHIYAAPNKLYDAMMVGVPVLINSECRISRFAESHGFGYSTPFGDIEALREALRKVLSPSSELLCACKTAQEAFKNEYEWGKMESRFSGLFDGLGVPRLKADCEESLEPSATG